MSLDPRTPVLVGAGQVCEHHGPEAVPPPAELWAEAARRAEADAGADLLRRLDTVASVDVATVADPDPGRTLAAHLGIGEPRTVRAAVGGNTPQQLVNVLAERIARGHADAVLVGGAECLDAKARRRAAGLPPWPVPTGPGPDEVVGDDRFGSSPYELAHGLTAPLQVYPLFETALRGEAGRDVDEHQRVVSELWAHFAAVARDNPHAWDRRGYSAEEIREVAPDNRLVCAPYTKRMCARIRVDMAAAVLLCSYEAAQAAGVAPDRLVFLHAGADAHDHWFATERASLAASPAIEVIGRAALAAAGIGVDDVARFDLYSCFPSAVQMAMAALGLRGPAGGDDRPLTVTGGLAFAGGPLNDYVSHSMAAMADALRGDPGTFGVTTGLGWYATKHSIGVWSTTPPAAGYRRIDPASTQAEVDAGPRVAVAGAYDGPATVEASSVSMERDGTPARAVVAARVPDGRRVLAATTDTDLAGSMVEEAWEGRSVAVRAEGEANRLLTP